MHGGVHSGDNSHWTVRMTCSEGSVRGALSEDGFTVLFRRVKAQTSVISLMRLNSQASQSQPHRCTNKNRAQDPGFLPFMANGRTPGCGRHGARTKSKLAKAARQPKTTRLLSVGRVPVTFSDLVMEVDGIHGSSDDVGLAVTCRDDPSHLVHELHGDACVENGHVADQTRGGCSPPWEQVVKDKALRLRRGRGRGQSWARGCVIGACGAHDINLASLGALENHHSRWPRPLTK